MPEEHDDFYIGYTPHAPPRIAKHTLVVAIVHIILSMAGATLVVAGMRDPGPGVWNTGAPVAMEGTYVNDPYPALLTPGGVVLVVNFGKQGAQERLRDVRPGSHVTLSGYPLHRDDREMLELAPEDDALRVDSTGGAIPKVAWSGEQATLVGEIVDSKCYLGAMKPGEGKTHKACATRCIHAGIPAVLVCWDERGRPATYLLADRGGGAPGEWLLPYVGERVQIRGEIGRLGPAPVLGIDRASIAPRGPRRSLGQGAE
jgi:hypothetical protein